MDRLKIMISSTVNDLMDERDAVEIAINNFRFHRFRSESMGSLSRSPQEVCDEMARECDIFILIVGESYGWVIPNLNISVTEREYNVAKETDSQKILIYCKSSSNREQRQVRFMEKVSNYSTGYFRSEFTTTKQLQERVQEDLSNLDNIKNL